MIGILPCAGKSERFNGLPKYLLPVGDSYLLAQHIREMQEAGCEQVCIGVNASNADLVGEFSCVTGHCATPYIADHYATMTETVLSIIDEQYDPVKLGHSIIFGMPDTCFDSNEVYEQLAYHMNSEADVTVALFEARPGQHKQGGMCLAAGDKVIQVIDKPESTSFNWIWGAIAWKPAFWDCLTPDMPHVGYGLPVAIERGLEVRAAFIEGNFWDCGTPERYFEMIRATTCDQ